MNLHVKMLLLTSVNVWVKIFLFSFITVKAQDCEHRNDCLAEDPFGFILKPLINNCTRNASKVEYWLYTPNSTVQLQPGDFVDRNKPINVLLHGWGGDKNTNSVQVIKKAYLERYGWNHTIIIVDYGMYVGGSTITSYGAAFCNVPAVAANVGSFLCNLYTSNGIDLNNVHLVGFSLGAQVSGFAGTYVQKTCGRVVGRITGLDPANPGFNCHSCKNYRIDSSDAKFVDVVHTDIFLNGTPLDSGVVDFYVNHGGPFQPGCFDYPEGNVTSLVENPLLIVNMIVSCSHQRSCLVFAESIILNDFLATSCWLGGEDLSECLWPDKVYMGEYCTSPQKYNSYYVSTKDKYPYGEGPNGPLH